MDNNGWFKNGWPRHFLAKWFGQICSNRVACELCSPWDIGKNPGHEPLIRGQAARYSTTLRHQKRITPGVSPSGVEEIPGRWFLQWSSHDFQCFILIMKTKLVQEFFNPQYVHIVHIYITGWWLEPHPSEKYTSESQLGGWSKFPIYFWDD